MIKPENLLLFGTDLEMDHPENAKKERPKTNCMQEIIIELMNDRGLTDADVIRDTGIPWSTWWGWITQEVKTPLTDENLRKTYRYFNVHLEYLVYGDGSNEPVFSDFETKNEKSG